MGSIVECIVFNFLISATMPLFELGKQNSFICGCEIELIEFSRDSRADVIFQFSNYS